MHCTGRGGVKAVARQLLVLAACHFTVPGALHYPASEVPKRSDTFDFPHFPIRMPGTEFCKGNIWGGLRPPGKWGKWDWGTWVSRRIFLPFFPITPPPPFRHFSATCRGCSYDFYSDLVMNPYPLQSPPIFPEFSIFPTRRLWVLRDFEFGCLGARMVPGAWQWLVLELRGSFWCWGLLRARRVTVVSGGCMAVCGTRGIALVNADLGG